MKRGWDTAEWRIQQLEAKVEWLRMQQQVLQAELAERRSMVDEKGDYVGFTPPVKMGPK